MTTPAMPGATPRAIERFATLRIIPVIVIDDPNDAVPLARALSDGGLPCAEITLRTPRALESLRRITAEVPEMFVGAGTVLTPTQAAEARDAGAKFAVAPGFNRAVVDYCQGVNLPMFPGVATPTEIETALGCGLSVLKFFPAEPMGGLAYLKAVAGPYTGVTFMPTGGISPANLATYLGFSRVVACGGSWMAPNDWIAARQFDRVREATREGVAIVAGLAAGARA